MIKQFAYVYICKLWVNLGRVMGREKVCGRREGLGEEVMGREEIMSRGEGNG